MTSERDERRRVLVWLRELEGKYGHIRVEDWTCAPGCETCRRPAKQSPEPDLTRWHEQLLAQERERLGKPAEPAERPEPPKPTRRAEPPKRGADW